jgi:hypothetical protein
VTTLGTKEGGPFKRQPGQSVPIEVYRPATKDPLSFSPEKTRATITTWLLRIFVGTIAVHYIAIGFVCWRIPDGACREEILDRLGSVFTALLPAQTGLLGAAIAFYFKGKD